MARLIRFMCVAMAVAVLGGVSFGCNTTEGVGRDMEDAGDAIEDTARDARD